MQCKFRMPFFRACIFFKSELEISLNLLPPGSEERMSMAKIRTCKKCECGFMKTDGCNKVF